MPEELTKHPSGAKASDVIGFSGTTQVVPFQNVAARQFFLNLWSVPVLRHVDVVNRLVSCC
jgi:hypothetical protein